MFLNFTAQLRTEVETIKSALDAHDSIRNLVYSRQLQPKETENAITPTAAASDCEQAIVNIRQQAPSKSTWQVYDQCAAITRIYAVYESFVDELATDYIRLLPSLYPKYDSLHENVRKQHRLGIAQILLKLGKDGPYKHLGENQIIGDLAHGLGGGDNYKLLPDAFLIYPQNYRAGVVSRIFCDLGFEDCWGWVEQHPPLVSFMGTSRDSTETAATMLHDLVEYRNQAAHTSVGETVAVDEIKSIADCVVLICEALAQFIMMQVIRRREELGEVSYLGDVIHNFSNQIVGVRTRAGSLAIGDELIVFYKYACYKVGVCSIRTGADPHLRLDVADDQEIGALLSLPARKGARLLRIKSTLQSHEQTPPEEPISPDVEPMQELAAEAESE